MAKSSNHFWLTSLRGDTNVTVLDTITGISSATAGQVLKTIAVSGDKAIVGVIITVSSSGKSVRIAAKVGSVQSPDTIALSANNTIADELFGNAVRVTNGNLQIVAVDAFTGVSGLSIAVYQADWSWWNA